ncbi:hypothetical protein FRUB_07632 [Fimbriiglobus ruber]|uniref:Uncharacterized protein n=1 Tax=Fimbriiglobus ruber TaxID=1908690 RepID=A0A225DAN1_9BACT|nr:hypothetical protein FRUB_07632 [Fimbriiglobus ruber]
MSGARCDRPPGVPGLPPGSTLGRPGGAENQSNSRGIRPRYMTISAPPGRPNVDPGGSPRCTPQVCNVFRNKMLRKRHSEGPNPLRRLENACFPGHSEGAFSLFPTYGVKRGREPGDTGGRRGPDPI